MPEAGTSCQIEVKEPNGGDANVSESLCIILNVCMLLRLFYYKPTGTCGDCFSGGVIAYCAANTF